MRRDRVLSFADLGLQLGDQIRDNRHLLHQHILPGLRVGAAGLSAFKVFLVFFALFLDGVQFLLQAVLFGFQLLLAVIGTGRQRHLEAQRKRQAAGHQQRTEAAGRPAEPVCFESISHLFPSPVIFKRLDAVRLRRFFENVPETSYQFFGARRDPSYLHSKL